MKPPTALGGDKYKVRKDPMKFQGQSTKPGWFTRKLWQGRWKWWFLCVMYILSIGPAPLIMEWLPYPTFSFVLPVFQIVYVPILLLEKTHLGYPLRWYRNVWYETFQDSQSSYDGAAAAALKTFYGMMATYRKKGYADLGRTFPVGNDPTVINNGLFCGLYYEVNNTGERVTLIGIADANADFRARQAADRVKTQVGVYIPVLTRDGKVEYQPPVVFASEPKQGYWFALMKYYQDGDKLIPYDREYSKEHYAIIAFPAEYGVTGEATFIINEEGTVYTMDFGKAEYIDTYPNDPVAKGWEIAK